MAENSTKIPEKETRRQLELRLMLQWATKTAATIPGWIYPSVREFLLGPYTELAIKNDALLYAIYAWTALHAATMSTESGREWAMDVYRTYLDLALQQHQVDIANLGKDNANVVCVTTTHLRQCIQTTLQDRIIDPYLPPVEWLHMTRGCADVFKTAWEWIGDDDTSIALHFIQRKPDMSDDSVLFNAANGEDLKYIMRRSCCEELDEPWDSEIEATYLAAIRYLGGARKAFEDKDANFDVICRWVMGFPMKMERRFVELVEEQRPRAMVVLAHYFALLSKLRDVWWVGDTGRREVRGIAETLPTDWIWLDMVCLLSVAGFGKILILLLHFADDLALEHDIRRTDDHKRTATMKQKEQIDDKNFRNKICAVTWRRRLLKRDWELKKIQYGKRFSSLSSAYILCRFRFDSRFNL